MPDAAARADRFKALATSGTGAFREWHVRTMPFNRASFDLSMALGRIDVDANGVPSPPRSRGFWSRLFSSLDLPDDAARQVRGIDEEPIDAAWLAEAIGAADVRQRSERLEQMAFGQRVFGELGAAGRDRADVFIALACTLALSHADRDARSDRHSDPFALRRRRASRGAAVGDRRPPRLRRPGAVSRGARGHLADGESA